METDPLFSAGPVINRNYWQASLHTLFLFRSLVYYHCSQRVFPISFFLKETNIEVCVQGRLFFPLYLPPPFPMTCSSCPCAEEHFLFCSTRLVTVLLPIQMIGIAIIFMSKANSKFCECKISDVCTSQWHCHLSLEVFHIVGSQPFLSF